MIDVAFYAFIAVLAVAATIYRLRRRQYRELGLWYGLVALILAGREGIYLLPEGWEVVGFWAVCAALVAWAVVARRVNRAASG
ncbi:hypothetical protein DVA67_032015 [Solirubrobacter sp. CPCC 204708]|uniref:Uncharacterized protein n=1 Tax=Solirubrobacter deserti TaxID=2282478 RepID=A0ABT4RQ65_9ACTN|nr:hypothetical protein [Solirubrobacter deserti]MBE2320630.1 hypothetical protein [Solirubrobacter deserti]MDA0140684.1 hypothetical protein [Solirubrobacter deserti]